MESRFFHHDGDSIVMDNIYSKLNFQTNYNVIHYFKIPETTIFGSLVVDFILENHEIMAL